MKSCTSWGMYLQALIQRPILVLAEIPMHSYMFWMFKCAEDPHILTRNKARRQLKRNNKESVRNQTLEESILETTTLQYQAGLHSLANCCPISSSNTAFELLHQANFLNLSCHFGQSWKNSKTLWSTVLSTLIQPVIAQAVNHRPALTLETCYVEKENQTKCDAQSQANFEPGKLQNLL